MKNADTENDDIALDLLLEKVYRDRGHDFREYKRGTLMRRLGRRFHATGARTCLDYMRFLDTHPEEYQKFAAALTLKISGFFRSQYTFHQMAKLVLPELVSHKRNQGKRNLKFWSTACAQGEEPYSIAILLAEFLGNQRQDFDIVIYATDISPWSLKEAQAGVFSPKDLECLTGTILKSYFTRHDEDYKVRAEIRQMVNFSYFNLTSTMRQPFLNLDCIFCCNVLVYLQPQLQERVLEMLYKSLATPGYLVLGEVETPTSSLCERLGCLDSKAKIYRKNRRG
jgi:chemotaxis methyl-accepting protein methylase